MEFPSDWSLQQVTAPQLPAQVQVVYPDGSVQWHTIQQQVDIVTTHQDMSTYVPPPPDTHQMGMSNACSAFAPGTVANVPLGTNACGSDCVHPSSIIGWSPVFSGVPRVMDPQRTSGATGVTNDLVPVSAMNPGQMVSQAPVMMHQTQTFPVPGCQCGNCVGHGSQTHVPMSHVGPAGSIYAGPPNIPAMLFPVQNVDQQQENATMSGIAMPGGGQFMYMMPPTVPGQQPGPAQMVLVTDKPLGASYWTPVPVSDREAPVRPAEVAQAPNEPVVLRCPHCRHCVGCPTGTSETRRRPQASQPRRRCSGHSGYSGHSDCPRTPHLFCSFCKANRETATHYLSHTLRDKNGIVTCPVLRGYTCESCGASGDNAHTRKYCPESPVNFLYERKRTATGKLKLMRF